MVRGSELLHATIAPSSQRDAPYQVSPNTLSSAQTPSMPTAVSPLGSLSSPTRLPSASLQLAVQVSFTSTLTSPAPLSQSHKRLRTIGGKNNVNPNSNVSNSVTASSSRGRGIGRSSRIETGVAELEVIKNLPKLLTIINGEQYTILSIDM